MAMKRRCVPRGSVIATIAKLKAEEKKKPQEKKKEKQTNLVYVYNLVLVDAGLHSLKNVWWWTPNYVLATAGLTYLKMKLKKKQEQLCELSRPQV